SLKGAGLSQIIFFVSPEKSDQRLFDEIRKKWGKGKVFPAGLNLAYFFETLRRRSEDKRSVWRDSAAAAFSHFLYNLLMRAEGGVEGTTDSLVEGLLKTMYQNIRADFSLKNEARRLGKSEAWLIRRFKDAMGSPPAHNYLRLKIEAAAESLRLHGRAERAANDQPRVEEKTVSQISEEFGFRDVFYFSKLFKKYTGLSPSVFRKRSG
ncbi:MAG: helix-turn-helix transcriptional regulator, partial [Spirochaetia bacterium]|nr:helix-turn-helix transcriptional regulator [Spirochaetia bacterium]